MTAPVINVEQMTMAAYGYMRDACTVDGTPTICLLTNGMTYVPQGLPGWFQVQQKLITLPPATTVGPGSLIAVTGKGSWQVRSVSSPETFQVVIDATCVPAGSGVGTVLGQGGQTITFRDDAEPDRTVSTSAVIYEVSPEEAQVRSDAVDKKWGLLFPMDTEYPIATGHPAAKDIGPGDKVLGFSEIPFGASITKPTPTLDPDFPLLRAYIRERS